MAKRFYDTGIFQDSWFSELTKDSKLLFFYLISKCDHAGVIDLNLRLAEFETGINGLRKSFDTLIEEFGDRLVHVRDNYYFLPKFVSFQYPRGLDQGVKAQASVIRILQKFELFDNSLGIVKEQFSNSSATVQDKDKDKDKDKDEDKDEDKGKEELVCVEENSGITAEDIYAAYPMKKGRAAAIKSIQKALKKADPEMLLEKVEIFAEKWRGKGKEFCPYPATWFNEERWLDEDLAQSKVDFISMDREEGKKYIAQYLVQAGVRHDDPYPAAIQKIQTYHDNGGFEI